MSHIVNKTVIADGFRFREQSVNPDPPTTGFRLLFVKNNGTYEIDSDGVVTGPFGSGGGGGTPGGSDKNIQYNNSGSFGGISNNATGTKKYLQQVSSGTPSMQQVADADLSVTDVTTNNATTSAHGFLPKLDNNVAHFLNGQGGFTTPAGGSNPPQQATLWADEFTYTTGAGAITYNVLTSQIHNLIIQTTSPADGDAVSCGFFLKAGSYTFHLLTATGSYLPKYDIYVDGATITTGIDCYSGGDVFNAVKTASVTILTDGQHTLQIKVNGKNVSSSNFYIQFTKMWFS